LGRIGERRYQVLGLGKGWNLQRPDIDQHDRGPRTSHFVTTFGENEDNHEGASLRYISIPDSSLQTEPPLTSESSTEVIEGSLSQLDIMPFPSGEAESRNEYLDSDIRETAKSDSGAREMVQA